MGEIFCIELFSLFRFYVRRPLPFSEKDDDDGEHFFEEINTLSRRQTVLFQRSCQQLKEIYLEGGGGRGECVGDSSRVAPASPAPSASSSFAAVTKIPTIGGGEEEKMRRPVPAPPRTKARAPPPPPVSPPPPSTTVASTALVPLTTTGAGAEAAGPEEVEELYRECLYCVMHQVII